SETAMRAWKAAYDAKLRATLDAAPAAPTAAAPAAATATPEVRSQVLQELELAKHEKEGGVDSPRA
ncbi:hypothetical protein JCM3770_001065, partial [Rhodotorula araucariae]